MHVSGARRWRVPRAADKPSLHATFPPADVKDDRFLGDTPSPGRRSSRALTFLIVAFIGVGCTLAWQSYGEAAKHKMRR